MKWTDASYLAHKGTRFHSMLNRIINGVHISHNVKIPKSTQLLHGNIIIGEGSIIGERVKIYPNTLIGQKYLDCENNPTIEDDVIISAGCIIIGKITIGKSSGIGAGTFVDKDIPAYSFVYNKKELVVK